MHIKKNFLCLMDPYHSSGANFPPVHQLVQTHKEDLIGQQTEATANLRYLV